MARIPRVEKLRRARSAIAGISKHLTRHATVPVAGKTPSPANLIAVFKAHVDAIEAVDLARIALSAAVRAERAAAKRAKALDTNLRSAVQTEFGLDPAVWAAFGWALPQKPGPKTVAGKVAGNEKRAVTRAARKTGTRRRRR